MIQVILTRKVDTQGRIVLPKSIRKKLDIQSEDRLVLTLKHGKILAEKQSDQLKEKRICYVTGITSPDCQPFSGGIDLSKEAALILLHELKSKQ